MADTHDCPAAIHFTPDLAAVVSRQIQDTVDALATILAPAKTPTEDGLDSQLATSALKVAEFNLDALCKSLGIVTDGAVARAQRYEDIRQANERVRALEAQLGAGQGPDVTQASLKIMVAHLNSWWDMEGFGHISKIAFGEHGCSVSFSCSLFGDFSVTNSTTPVSNKERKARWRASLRERGFVLVEDDHDWSLGDCDASRKALSTLITSRLPSARITSMDNVNRHRSESFILRGVSVFISNISEILLLPAKATGAGEPEPQA